MTSIKLIERPLLLSMQVGIHSFIHSFICSIACNHAHCPGRLNNRIALAREKIDMILGQISYLDCIAFLVFLTPQLLLQIHLFEIASLHTSGIAFLL